MKKATLGWLFRRSAKGRSALAELLAATRAVETDLFTFDFTRIASHEASVLQRRLQRFVVVDQRAGDAVANGASLAGFTAAVHVDLHVEGCVVRGQHQRL